MPLHRNIAAGCVAIFLLLAFTVFRPPSTPGPLARDFEAYYAAGVTVNGGGDPYSRAVWTAERHVPGVRTSREELLPYVGPAATLPLWSLLARLPYLAALALWSALLLASVGVILAIAWHIAQAPRDTGRYCLAVAFAFAAAPLIGAVALGQAALVSAAAVAAATVAYTTRSAVGATGATFVAALQPNLAVALIARMRSRWDLLAAAAAATAFGVLALAAGGGVAGWFAYVARLRAHGQAERFIAIQHTPAAIAFAFGASDGFAVGLNTFVAIGAACAVTFLIIRQRLDGTTAMLLACAALPLAVPFFHEHDFVLEVLPILVLALRARGFARRLGAIAAVLVLVDWFGLAQRPQAQAQILSLGLATAIAFIGLRGITAHNTRTDFAGPLVLIVVAALALPLAAHHVAPTWPDMLPAAYHAPLDADTSTVWADEQRAAGLARRDPVWGMLRLLPLLGCGVLAAALVLDHRARRRVARRRLLNGVEHTLPIGFARMH